MIKLSGSIDLKVKLNIDFSWTYGKLENRIQYLTGINEGKMSVRVGNDFPYDDDYICFSNGLLVNFIEIDVLDRIWLEYN
jgi:hypothetical protein